MSATKATTGNASTYRVKFVEDKARVMCFGIPISTYALFEQEVEVPTDELPEWITRRVAVLSTMSYEPPTEWVNSIGRRISENVYWVFYEGDEDGDDT